MTNPLIISFYTDDWTYADHARRMKDDCQRLNLECYIEQRESTRDYIRNTAIKPIFVKQCLEKFQRSVLWVDVDGLMLKKFPLSDLTEDFAACEYRNKKNLDRDWSVCMLWFNYTPGSLLLVNEWCNNAHSGTDEAAFDVAWKKLKHQVTVHKLPDHYIFSKWRSSLVVPDDTVFCNQLSQFEDKMRRKINGQVKE